MGDAAAVAAECWRVLAPRGVLITVTCRDLAERTSLLARWFASDAPDAAQPLPPVRHVWAERAAPCPTCSILALRRRDAPLPHAADAAS